jgi:crotonobetainyl-CoA:carnitine CoA-transferase CaiB-like acyl-CoA transferase
MTASPAPEPAGPAASPSLPLAGRRVVELGTMLAAPFAAHLLAQLGAEVIKVEPPRGDPTRALVRGGPSGTFIAYSHGKKSACLDLATAAGRDAFHRLLASADAFVHNLAPQATRKLGLTREHCAAVNPRLIYCHIRGYGDGPQGDELASNPVAEAATGVMESHRIEGRPSRLGPSYHDQFAGAYAVIGMLAAMLQAAEGRAPAPVEVGLYETGLHVAARDLVGVQLKTHLFGRPEREPHGEFSMPGYGAYETADGRWLYLVMLSDAHWARFCEALELPQASEPSLATLRQRKKAREQVEALVREAVRERALEDTARRLKGAGVGCTEVLPLERVLDAPQARAPGKLQAVRFRGLEFQVPAFPWTRGAETPTPAKPIEAQELGADTRPLLQALGLSEGAWVELQAQGPSGEFAWAPVRREA